MRRLCLTHCLRSFPESPFWKSSTLVALVQHDRLIASDVRRLLLRYYSLRVYPIYILRY